MAPPEATGRMGKERRMADDRPVGGGTFSLHRGKAGKGAKRERAKPHAPGPGTGRRRLFLFLLVVALGWSGAALLLDTPLSLETLRAHRDALLAVRAAHPLLAALVFVAGYAAVVSLSLPGALVMSLAGGWLFGPWLGTLVNLAGAGIGAIVIFLMVRQGMGAFLTRRIDLRGGRAQHMLLGLRRNEINYLLAMRLLPAVPFFVANVLPALIGVRTRNYVVTTLVGILPGTLVISHAGAGLGRLLEGNAPLEMDTLFDWRLTLPLAGLALLVLVPALWRTIGERAAKPPPSVAKAPAQDGRGA